MVALCQQTVVVGVRITDQQVGFVGNIDESLQHDDDYVDFTILGDRIGRVSLQNRFGGVFVVTVRFLRKCGGNTVDEGVDAAARDILVGVDPWVEHRP